MNNLIRNLTLILILQLVAITYLQTREDNLATFVGEEKLLPFEESQLTEVIITLEKDKQIKLVKEGERWVVDDPLRFPVSHRKISESLTPLFKIERPFPIARTDAAAKKLELTEDGFDRKVEFKLGDKGQTLFLGTVPSYKLVHVKLADEPESYVVEFGSHTLGVEPKDWYDRDFLALADDQVSVIEVNGLKLQRQDETWTIEGLKEEEAVDQAELRSALNSLLKISFSELMGQEDQPDFNSKNVAFSFKILKSDGTERIVSFSKPKTGEDLIVKASDHPYYFKVIAFAMDSIKNISRDKLVKTKPANDEENANNQPAEISD